MGKVDISEFDIILTNPISISILKKVLRKWNGKYVGEIAWSIDPFNLISNHFEKNDADEISPNSIKCYTVRKKIQHIDRNKIKKNTHEIDNWKVATPKAQGKGGDFLGHHIFLIESGAVCTQTYRVIDTFKTEHDAKKLIQYLRTDFARYLMMLRKITQDISRQTFNWVPYMDLKLDWTNAKLHEYFGISTWEQNHIRDKLNE